MTNYIISKTFESHQKWPRSSIDDLVGHPNFWWELPEQYTKRDKIISTLESGNTVKIQVPGYVGFYMKPIEGYTSRNGVWQLMGLLAATRQGQWVAGAYLVYPDEIVSGKLDILRNTDRYKIRSMTVHYGAEASEVSETTRTIGSILSREIKSLAILDKKIF